MNTLARKIYDKKLKENSLCFGPVFWAIAVMKAKEIQND